MVISSGCFTTTAQTLLNQVGAYCLLLRILNPKTLEKGVGGWGESSHVYVSNLEGTNSYGSHLRCWRVGGSGNFDTGYRSDLTLAYAQASPFPG